MINLFFVYCCIFLMMLTGIIVCKLLQINDAFLNRNGILIFPGIGIIFVVNVVLILNVFVPVCWIVYPYVFFIIWGVCKYWKSIKCYFSALFGNRKFLITIVGVSIIWMIPFLNKSEMVSIQTWNNDIIYYLASMEWLKAHSAVQAVSYDTFHPLFWCAEYMLERTRIGFDSYAAFIMSLFGLEAYEVFSCLGIVSGITMLFHVYYMFSTFCKIPSSFKWLALFIIALAGRFEELLIYQYIPQMYGISFMILFIALSYIFFESEGLPRGILALVISGIVAVYAEFCAYLVVLYIGFAIRACGRRNKGVVGRGWIEGILAILINPIGTFRAIKLNLFVLFNTGDKLNNIDPFYGEISSATDMMAQIFGVCQETMFSGTQQYVYKISWGIIFMGFALMWMYYLLKVKDPIKYYLFYILGFWMVYELYFRFIRYGYGEYKHLISVTVIALVASLYVGYHFLININQRHFRNYIYGLVCFFLLICGGYKIYNHLIANELYYFDKSLMELKEAGNLIPANEAIGISGSPASIHAEVYALHEHPAVILSNYISYFPYSEDGTAHYQLYEGDFAEREDITSARYVWGNDRFYILENINVQVVYYTGFHLDNFEDNSIYTCDNESSLMIYNYATDTKCFSVAFQSTAISEATDKIRIMLNGKVIALGEVGDYIVSDLIVLNPDENVQVYIYYDGETEIVEDKSFGFGISDLKTIIYADIG